MNNRIFLPAVVLSAFLFLQFQAFSFCDNCSSKCGTHLMFTNSGKEQLQRSLDLDNNGIPKTGQRKIPSKSNVFMIHFDTVGVHAPPIKDSNHNGIPDYVDSVSYYFDYVYNIYINELGYRSPYPDNGGRGSNHYDIYLYDLGNSDDIPNPVNGNYHQGGTYGLTYNHYSDFISDKPFARFYTFIMIDNDFSELDSVRPIKSKSYPAYKFPGIPSLKVTVAHEFFHAIQFMYGISQPANTTVMEMTAVAMERVFFPEVTDYLQYVRKIFRNTSSYPFGLDDPDTGYGHSIFNQYLIEKFGIEIMRMIWENVGKGIEVYKAIDFSLGNFGFTFGSAWCDFLDWAYYTGDRAIIGQYFSNAFELPKVEPFSFVEFEPPSKSTSGNLAPVELRFVRMIFPAGGTISDDTLDVFLGNIDLDAASKQILVTRNYYLQATDTEISDSKKIEGTNYWKYSEIDSSFICTSDHISTGGSTFSIDYAYPNPVRLNSDTYIMFPAPEGSEIYQKVSLVIYDSNMNQVLSKTLTITAHSKNRIVHLSEIPKELTPGVYIFGVHNGDKISLGKFAITEN